MTSIRQAAACMDLVRLGDAFEIDIEMQDVCGRRSCRTIDSWEPPLLMQDRWIHRGAGAQATR